MPRVDDFYSVNQVNKPPENRLYHTRSTIELYRLHRDLVIARPGSRSEISDRRSEEREARFDFTHGNDGQACRRLQKCAL